MFNAENSEGPEDTPLGANATFKFIGLLVRLKIPARLIESVCRLSLQHPALCMPVARATSMLAPRLNHLG